MQMTQIAFYCQTEEAERLVKSNLGLLDAEWIQDTVYADVSVRGWINKNVAKLQFNYSLGCELEIIRYVQGPHWMQDIVIREPFLAHVGIHLDEGQDWPKIYNWKLVQEAATFKHEAKHLNEGPMAGRKYFYRIYEVSPHTFIKYIKRRNP